jgi:hypothetical protein
MQQGANYFAYSDIAFKEQVIEFVLSLIISSDYKDWQKRGRLLSVIKLPDLEHIITVIAAMMWRDGYDGFRIPCSRPVSEDYPNGCNHVEELKLDVFNLILKRFSVLGEESIDYLATTRLPGSSHSLKEISTYQAGLGFEVERVVVGSTSFTMKIPTLMEYLNAGAQFRADIENEVEADNVSKLHEFAGFRYVRTFLPWIASVEVLNSEGGGYRSADEKVIRRRLETLDGPDTRKELREKIEGYIGKIQLTYIGYVGTQCPVCHHMPDTPSGLLTIDPFSTFFTLASRYTTETA